jgi:cell division protein FtsW (lipid II flippase)
MRLSPEKRHPAAPKVSRLKPNIWTSRIPWTVVAIVLALMAMGTLAIARCDELTGGGGHYARQQIVWSMLALGGMFLTTTVSYRVLCRWSYAIFAVAVLLLVTVYFLPAVNHAHRWVRLGPIGVQPSEFAKVAFVLALARWLMYRESHRRLLGLAAPLALALIPTLLILKEPDLGTSSVFLPVMLVMLFAAGARRVDLARFVLLGLLVLPLVWTQMSHEQKTRVTALFEQAGPGTKTTDATYQLHQAKLLVALGATWGSAIGGQQLNDPAVYYLPEARTDFIFSVLGERFGLLGMAVVLGLFGLLVWRGQVIAANTREPFGRLLAAGLSGLFAVQVLINTGMAVGLLPVTGLSLPLMSYGGSGVVAHCLALGLLLNVGMRPGYELSNEPFRYVEK